MQTPRLRLSDSSRSVFAGRELTERKPPIIGNIGPLEIGIVVLIALIVFGPKRLPELGHGLGRGMREFKESITGEDKESVERQLSESPAPEDDRPAMSAVRGRRP